MQPIQKLRLKLHKSPLLKRLAGGILWSFFGAVIARALTLLASIIVSRHLGKEAFGELGVLQSTINMLGELAGAGIGIASTKFVAQLRETDPENAARILSVNGLMAGITGTLFTILLIIFADPFAEHFLNRKELSGLLQIGAAALLFSTLSGAQMGALAGFEAFDRIARLNILSGVCSLILQTTFMMYWGLSGVVVALLLTYLVTFAVGHVLLRAKMRAYAMRFDFSNLMAQARHLYSFNLPAMISSIIVGPTNWVCNLLLVRHINGYAELGVFNAANQWRMALLFIPTTLGSVVLPILANIIGSKNMHNYKRVLKYNLAINAATSLLLIVCVFAVSNLIMASYGADFVEGKNVLRVLIVVAGLMAINNIIGQAISSLGELWFGLAFNAIWAATLILSAAVLCPRYGAIGLAYANLIAYAAHSLWQGLYVRRRLVKIID